MKKISIILNVIFTLGCVISLTHPMHVCAQDMPFDPLTGIFDTTILNRNNQFNALQDQLKCNPPVDTKGVYLTAYSASSKDRIDWVIERAKQGLINAVVIDIKDDSGRLTISTDNPILNDYGVSINIIDNIESIIKRLKDNGIYTIARIVTFKDPFIAEIRNDWALHLQDGSLYRDGQGLAWVDPYNQDVWDYVLQTAYEAVNVGFNEIQFDYIRFCTERKVNQVVYDEAIVNGRSQIDAITQALKYFYEHLKPLGVYVSADVFGAVIDNPNDQASVGQRYSDLALYCDYISPMIYPSHYGNGAFGLKVPDLQPYECIDGALKASNAVLQPYIEQGTKVAKVRPWLQDFTASYLRVYKKYTYEEVQEQIQATYDNGYKGYLLWNAANVYHLKPDVE